MNDPKLLSLISKIYHDCLIYMLFSKYFIFLLKQKQNDPKKFAFQIIWSVVRALITEIFLFQ